MNAIRLSTSVNFSSPQQRIGFDDRLFALGSCFSQYMAERLAAHKALIHGQPFGILFNPASIARSIKLINQELKFAEPFLQDGAYVSLDAHSDVHAPSIFALEQELERRQQAAVEAWEEAQHVMITFGTAAVYEHRSSGLIVANCHRLPQSEFDRYLLSVEDVVEIWSEILDEFSRKQFLLSVSPVRHVRDGLHENSVSKATLHLAMEQLCQNHPNAVYVPAYEYIIDELRDYRYYARDLCHPNELAVDLLWQQFVKHYCDYECQELMADIAEILQAMKHKPRNEHSEAHRQFCQQQQERVKELQEHYPERDWTAELERFMFS